MANKTYFVKKDGEIIKELKSLSAAKKLAQAESADVYCGDELVYSAHGTDKEVNNGSEKEESVSVEKEVNNDTENVSLYDKEKLEYRIKEMQSTIKDRQRIYSMLGVLSGLFLGILLF